MNNINNIKELLKEEELIIPEIQRDYVWGDNELVIKRFINNIKNMKDNEELDIGFFYSYKIYENFNALIDGQQRITTLILLSWYVGVDNTKLNNFKFKVRENSNNFLEKLLEQKSAEIPAIDGKKISDKIKNSIWYKRIWDNDPTVKSILNALDIIDKELDNKKENIKNKIDNIKFSCIEAGDRRLETEYILLNKRGVNLTNSEQLKAILTEDIENKNEWLEKWEKDWQDILWECKGEDIYNTDNIWNAVLYWVRDIYVIENNICKDNDKEKINYDFDLIGIEKENKEKVLKMPNLSENEICEFVDNNPEQHFTTPPPRYNDASLVKTLEESGIGRPSTYAPTIRTIIARHYIQRKGKQLVPTELGKLVNELISENFSELININFTANMESKLDKIEDDNIEWNNILKEFYPHFLDTLKTATENIHNMKDFFNEETDFVCEKCGRKMIKRLGRYGYFIACSGFPECKNAKGISFGVCPKCKGDITLKRSKRGREFYGCSNYPKCDFVSWDKPIQTPCPKCNGLMVERQIKNKGLFKVCIKEDCGYSEEISEDSKEE